MKKKNKAIPDWGHKSVNFLRWRLDYGSHYLNGWKNNTDMRELFMNWEDFLLNIPSEEERKYYNE